MRSLLQTLRRRLAGKDGSASGDAELLSAYLETRDGSAFEQIVQRHGPMVFGVCRRMAPTPTDAEDAFQAVWLVLVQKGNSISPRSMLGNWLYGVAVNVSRRSRVQHARRLERERSAAAPEMQLPAPTDDGLSSILDEEIARLPDRFRAVVVACDVEGLSRSAAASRLALAEGTVASRLSRGRAMLANKLLKRGIGGATAVAGTVALPNHLYASALAAQASDSLIPSASAQMLAEEAGRMMSHTRNLWMLGAVAAGLVPLATVVTVFAAQERATPTENKPTAPTPTVYATPVPRPSSEYEKPRVVANPAKDIKVITDRDETIPQFFNRQKIIVASILEEKIKPQLTAKEPSKLLFVGYPAYNADPDARTYGTSVKIAPVSKEVHELVQERIKDNKDRGALQLVFVVDAKEADLVHLVGYTLRNSVSFFEGKKHEADDFAPADLAFKPKK